MANKPIPEKLTGYKIYNEGERQVGHQAETALPNFEAMTTTISGAGIAGEIDSPNPGRFGSMTQEITYRTLSDESMALAAPIRHQVTLRGNQQVYDYTLGQTVDQAVKVVMAGKTKSFEMGTFNTVGGTVDTKITLELEYVKVELDGQPRLELDKYNEIYEVNGVDYLAAYRNNT